MLSLLAGAAHGGGHSPIWETIRGALGGGASLWIFSTVIQNMPHPKDNERWYGWFYAVVQAIGANHGMVKPETVTVNEALANRAAGAATAAGSGK